MLNTLLLEIINIVYDYKHCFTDCDYIKLNNLLADVKRSNEDYIDIEALMELLHLHKSTIEYLHQKTIEYAGKSNKYEKENKMLRLKLKYMKLKQ